MGFNLLLDLLTCYSNHGGQKLSLVVRLPGCTRVEEVRRPSPCAGKSIALGSASSWASLSTRHHLLSAAPLAEARSTPHSVHVFCSHRLFRFSLSWRLCPLEIGALAAETPRQLRDKSQFISTERPETLATEPRGVKAHFHVEGV